MDRVAVAECVPSRFTEVGEIPQLRPFPFGTVQVNPIAPTKFATGEMVKVELVDAFSGRQLSEVLGNAQSTIDYIRRTYLLIDPDLSLYLSSRPCNPLFPRIKCGR